MAFNAKNLSYDRQEPAFLRRLKGQQAGDADRQERPVARPKRLKNDEEDDGPTYVVEDSGDTLSKEQYAALVAGKDATEPEGEKEDADADAEAKNGPDEEKNENAALKSKQKVAEIGAASRKRKAVKVGGGADEEEEDAAENSATAKKEKPTKKPKKKAKAVKLSFGDDEENT
ncbi:hypothetical protein K490DRAFT_65877 [Saccharata proteae CBS 121410]|uniref:DUF4604 domain-containing protein n=1 Tax=Saccharata proteae CBS 121410 TaxID=1314787 RepID=A0A9P4HT36_9PEZI|nr:hypothetical protein K490DRAFT_65877 [Saccharata proteae CBS 121410]